MADNKKDELNESLAGYKSNITPIVKTTLVWERDLVFTGATPQGYEIEFDAQAQWGLQTDGGPSSEPGRLYGDRYGDDPNKDADHAG